MKTVLSNRIINFRFGQISQGFEDRPANAGGSDELAEIVKNADGTYSIKSPDGTEWLSVQPDGSLESRPSSSEPGGWEKFTKQGNVLTEKPKDEVINRALVQLIVRDL